jgi:hypothetical protein
MAFPGPMEPSGSNFDNRARTGAWRGSVESGRLCAPGPLVRKRARPITVHSSRQQPSGTPADACSSSEAGASSSAEFALASVEMQHSAGGPPERAIPSPCGWCARRQLCQRDRRRRGDTLALRAILHVPAGAGVNPRPGSTRRRSRRSSPSLRRRVGLAGPATRPIHGRDGARSRSTPFRRGHASWR